MVDLAEPDPVELPLVVLVGFGDLVPEVEETRLHLLGHDDAAGVGVHDHPALLKPVDGPLHVLVEREDGFEESDLVRRLLPANAVQPRQQTHARARLLHPHPLVLAAGGEGLDLGQVGAVLGLDVADVVVGFQAIGVGEVGRDGAGEVVWAELCAADAAANALFASAAALFTSSPIARRTASGVFRASSRSLDISSAIISAFFSIRMIPFV